MSGTGSAHAQRPEVAAELADHIYHDEDLGKRTFAGKVAPNEEIQDFLNATDLYDTEARRWRAIDTEPYTDEKLLYAPIVAIIQAILRHFEYSDTRSCVNTHKKKFTHSEGREEYHPPQLRTSPDVAILGSGTNFKPEAVHAGIPNYDICASPVEVKTQHNFTKGENLTQIAIYTRQLFIQQSNRKFVCCPIITEKYARLYIFDRSGVHVHQSSPIHIHQEATDFVRLILGVSSPDDSLIGFDTSIYWLGDKRVLETVDADKNPVTLTLEPVKPIFYRRTIRGRGTCCWKAKDDEGKVVLVKDAWRSRGRTAEWKLLEAVKGLAGVGQMIAYEDNDDQHISTLRGITVFLEGFCDRTFSRLILEYYGPPIEGFETPQDLLFAYRDAIAGHQNLLNIGILHRDVSINNILIAKSGSAPGNRGVLIDLDMAIRINVAERSVQADFRTGTRAFQSLNVVQSCGKTNMTQDYLDDLESFYYVLCWVCFGYAGPNKILDPFPDRLAIWESGNPDVAAGMKTAFLAGPLAVSFTTISSCFGPVFLRLLENLHSFFRDLMFSRFASHGPIFSKQGSASTVETKIHPSPERVEQDYATILGFVDTAIAELLASPAPTNAEPESEAMFNHSASLPTIPTTRLFSTREPLSDILRNGGYGPGPSSPLKRHSNSAYSDEDSPKLKKSRTRNRHAARQPSSLSIERD
ncbi:hypothetical protein BDZ97DRAFT_1851662 [Flammula alnicola]|nr:hypothetical protein BDZ97DRAFT_1851662 [Flammula alnicola]